MIDKYLDLAKEQKKLWNMKATVIPIVIGALGSVPKDLVKKTEGIGNHQKDREYSDHSIAKIGSNTQKCLGNLRGIFVTHSPDHQLILASCEIIIMRKFAGYK